MCVPTEQDHLMGFGPRVHGALIIARYLRFRRGTMTVQSEQLCRWLHELEQSDEETAHPGILVRIDASLMAMDKEQHHLPKCVKLPRDIAAGWGYVKRYIATGGAICSPKAIGVQENMGVAVQVGSNFAPATSC